MFSMMSGTEYRSPSPRRQGVASNIRRRRHRVVTITSSNGTHGNIVIPGPRMSARVEFLGFGYKITPAEAHDRRGSRTSRGSRESRSLSRASTRVPREDSEAQRQLIYEMPTPTPWATPPSSPSPTKTYRHRFVRRRYRSPTTNTVTDSLNCQTVHDDDNGLLAKLPFEVLEQILLPLDPQSLMELALANKFWAQLILKNADIWQRKYLHDEVDWRWAPDDAFKRIAINMSPRSIDAETEATALAEDTESQQEERDQHPGFGGSSKKRSFSAISDAGAESRIWRYRYWRCSNRPEVEPTSTWRLMCRSLKVSLGLYGRPHRVMLFGPGLTIPGASVLSRFLWKAGPEFSVKGLVSIGSGMGSGVDARFKARPLHLFPLYGDFRKARMEAATAHKANRPRYLDEQLRVTPAIAQLCSMSDGLMLALYGEVPHDALDYWHGSTTILSAISKEVPMDSPLAILVFYNDLEKCIPCSKLIEHMDLVSLQRPWHIYRVHLHDMEGLMSGLNYLMDHHVSN
eukprot:Clim_evm48s191 gene=Clim_evmTU48s191